MSKFKYPKYCNQPSDIPVGEHFAILCFSSIYIPGDERSRTNPGHGYGERYETSCSYEIYENREEWEKAIEYKIKSKEKFVPLTSKRPTVEQKVIVNIS